MICTQLLKPIFCYPLTRANLSSPKPTWIAHTIIATKSVHTPSLFMTVICVFRAFVYVCLNSKNKTLS